MDAFDRRVRDSVQLHVIHGFWKRNDLNRVVLSVCGRCLTMLSLGDGDTCDSLPFVFSSDPHSHWFPFPVDNLFDSTTLNASFN